MVGDCAAIRVWVLQGDRIMSVSSSSFFSHAFKAGCGAILLLSSSAASLLADDAKPAETPPASPALKQGFQLQETDDIALPLQPVKPLSAGDQLRNDAVAWFMSGRVLETRNEPRRAVTAYRKAIALDPKAIEVYRQLVPLEFQLNEIEAAVQSATRAVEIDPQEYELWQMLAAQAAISGKLPEAIHHLEQAVHSSRVGKESIEAMVLNKSLGVLYSATGQPDKAADCYEVVFNALVHPEKFNLDSRVRSRMLADPQTSYERIGQVFLDAKRIKLAEEAFDLAAKTGRIGAGNLNFNRARVLLLSDKPEESLAELQKYFDAQRTTKGRDAYQLLADILEKLKLSDELITRLETLAAKDEQNLQLQFFLAEKLADANELEKARQIYETALPHGADATGYVGLARVLRKMKRSSELLDLLNRAMNKLGPEGLVHLEAELKTVSEDSQIVDGLMAVGREQAKAEPSQLTFEKAFLLAGLAKAIDRTDDAIEFYRAAIRLRKERNIQLYAELGTLLNRAHRYEAAEELFKEALAERRSAPERAQLLSMLARVQLAKGNLDESLKTIEEALQLEPGDKFLLFEEASLYMHARQWDQAVARFEKLRDQFPEEKRVLRLCQFSLSNIYVMKGEYRKGEEILEKVLEVDPEDNQVNNDLGYLWADQGKNLDRAEKMIRKAIAAEPDNGAYLDSLGWVLFKQGKYQEALPPIEEAVKKNTGGDSTLWDHLGDVQFQLKQIDKAVESWKHALKSGEEEKFSDPKHIERLKDKLKQHAPQASQPKPATPGAP
jgi:tetratricopeptide (TPR) repeat protein